MARLEEISAVEIGERLKIARVSAGKTQDEVSNEIGVSRPTLVAIERGQRKIRADELEKLSRLYGMAVNRLLASDAVHVDLQAKFRKSGQNRPAALSAIALLSQLASASVELERMLGVSFAPSYPSAQPILPGSIDRQGEEAAMSFRSRLGLGLAPISDIVSLLEQEVGIRVFVRKLASNISGLFAYEATVGACILLNANHPWERRALTAAHETGHFLSSRSVVDVVETDEKTATQEERFATAFSLSLLMPAAALRRRFAEILESDNRFTPRHLVLMAHAFHVSPEAMCRQLERLEIIPAGTYDSLRDRGFNASFIRGMLGDPAPQSPALPVSPRLAQLASSAYRRGLLSEGQLSRMLSLERVELRELLDRFGGDASHEVQIPLN
jgi:Zn-dependent peptidase ImmA (M78 family)/transcriptional regulator with XRE-family HTH domain